MAEQCLCKGFNVCANFPIQIQYGGHFGFGGHIEFQYGDFTEIQYGCQVQYDHHIKIQNGGQIQYGRHIEIQYGLQNTEICAIMAKCYIPNLGVIFSKGPLSSCFVSFPYLGNYLS